MENAGILDVFPIFHTARLGQKIRRRAQLPPKRCCPKYFFFSPAGRHINDTAMIASYRSEADRNSGKEGIGSGFLPGGSLLKAAGRKPERKRDFYEAPG